MPIKISNFPGVTLKSPAVNCCSKLLTVDSFSGSTPLTRTPLLYFPIDTKAWLLVKGAVDSILFNEDIFLSVSCQSPRLEAALITSTSDATFKILALSSD